MIPLPNPEHPIPERLKADNWAFHRVARSDDPAYRCQNIGNLVDNLIATISVAGLDEFEINHAVTIEGKSRFFKTLGEFLKYQVLGANLSWNLYSQGKTGEAVEVAKAVLRDVLFLVYDDRFTTSQKDSFIGREKTP